MAQSKFVKNLLQDYLSNKEERDKEYFESLDPNNQQWAATLWQNIKKHQETSSEVELFLLISEIEKLEKLTSSETWYGDSIGEVLKSVTLLQIEESLRFEDVLDVLVKVKLCLGKEVTSEIEPFKKQWIEKVFKRQHLEISNFPKLFGAIQPYRLLILEKVFKNVTENYDEHVVGRFFVALNESSFKHQEKADILEGLATEVKDFHKALTLLFLKRTEQVLKRSGFSENDFEKLSLLFGKLFSIEWSSEGIYNAISKVLNETSKCQAKSSIDQLSKCFEIAFDFHLGENELTEVLEEIEINYDPELSQEKFVNLEKMFHSRALRQFSKSHVKTLNELLDELTDLNDSLKLDLRKEYMKIMVCLHIISKTTEEKSQKFTEHYIKKWARGTKKGILNPSKHEKIAVVLRGFELFKHKVRDVQVLALILLYKKSTGILAQINTGEGKTAIIAMLACLYALDGKKVDIGKF